ncbi:flagellar hook-length control protein FliK [Thermithiobacillus plumbiphilus]|uniref:Flagellar hook-length control protein FliK n=1 Tax=Thermithiobacillus plumbiphilus TaxID=1729899 RepID=A0ABU9D3J2_9PROT
MKIPVWLGRLLPQGPLPGGLQKLALDPAGPESFPFQRGEVLTGRVIAALRNDTWLVNLAGRPFAMSLPDKPAPGTALRLVVLEAGPRPVLLLSRPSESSAPVQFSPDARFLSQLRQQPGPESTGSVMAQIRSSLPLLTDNSRPAAPQLANALQQALGSSGLFYESHLAGWATGALPLARLLAEPQGGLSSPMSGAATPTDQQRQIPQADTAELPPSPGIATAARTHPALPETRMAEQLRQAYLPAAANEHSPIQGVSDKGGRLLTDLMQQQLNLLDHAPLQWSGPVWPGQDMQWELYREQDEDQDAQAGAGEAPMWYSTLRLQLPRLGEICIQIRLQNQQLALQVQADPAVHGLLAQQTELRRALEAADLSLTSLRIEAHENAT